MYLPNNTTSVKSGAGISSGNVIMIDAIECYSVLAWRIYLQQYQHLTLAFCFSLTVLPVVLLNFALSFGLYKVGELRKKSKFLIFALGISDTVFGLVVIPLNIILVTALKYQRSCWFETTFLFVGQANGHFSFYTVMAIALERYLNIVSALKFGAETQSLTGRITRSISSKKGHRVLIIVMSICSLLNGLVTTYFFGTVRTSWPNFFMVCLRLTILFTIYILYSCMYFAIKKHVRQNQPLNSKHSQVFRTVATILIIYTICYIPCLTLDMWTSYYSYMKKSAAPNILRFLYYLSFFPVYMNGAFNAGILLKANKRALEYNLRPFCAIFKRRNTGDVEIGRITRVETLNLKI